MTAMLERVARAILRTHFIDGPIGDGGCDGEWRMQTELARDSVEQARAAIQAMREPDESMLDAIDKTEVLFQCAPKWNYRRQWQAAIDAATRAVGEVDNG